MPLRFRPFVPLEPPLRRLLAEADGAIVRVELYGQHVPRGRIHAWIEHHHGEPWVVEAVGGHPGRRWRIGRDAEIRSL